MSADWFRSWHGAPTDPKWLTVAKRASVSPGIVAAVVWALLDRASQSAERGCIEGYDPETLGDFYGVSPLSVDAIVKALHEKGVLHENRFCNWEKHQPKKEDPNATDRSKKHRERHATLRNADERDETPGNSRGEERREDTEVGSNEPTIGVSDETLVPEGSGTLRAVAENPDRKGKSDKRKAEIEFFQDVVAEWNALADGLGLPSVKDITETRQSAMRARAADLVKTYEFGSARDGFRELFAKIRGSPFLTGRAAGRDFRCDFDFATTPKSFTSIMEGKYETRQTQRW